MLYTFASDLTASRAFTDFQAVETESSVLYYETLSNLDFHCRKFRPRSDDMVHCTTPPAQRSNNREAFLIWFGPLLSPGYP